MQDLSQGADAWRERMRKWAGAIPATLRPRHFREPEERANEFPEGGRLLGRWHDMAGRTGILIIESNDLATVHRWLGRWNPYLDVDLTPVVEPPVNDPCESWS
jgi:hypothetical protein